jgi:hypothetical protein
MRHLDATVKINIRKSFILNTSSTSWHCGGQGFETPRLHHPQRWGNFNEITRLSLEKIDLDRKLLTIDAAASKVRHRRLVNLHPTCVAWLNLGGQLRVETNRRRRMDALKEAARIEEWPHDVLRHTAASHLVALHGARTAAEMLGNSETMLFKHYRSWCVPRKLNISGRSFQAEISGQYQ